MMNHTRTSVFALCALPFLSLAGCSENGCLTRVAWAGDISRDQFQNFELGSSEWEAQYQASKFTDRPRYGSLRKSHIGLQDHWDKVWYRNIRVLEH